jgi:hypothetical protein
MRVLIILNWLRSVIRWGGYWRLILGRVTEEWLLAKDNGLHLFLWILKIYRVLTFLKFDRVYCVHFFLLFFKTNLILLRNILIIVSSACILVDRILLDFIRASLRLVWGIWIFFFYRRLRILTKIVRHTAIYRLLTLTSFWIQTFLLIGNTSFALQLMHWNRNRSLLLFTYSLRLQVLVVHLGLF